MLLSCFCLTVPKKKTCFKRMKCEKETVDQAIIAVLEGKSLREATCEYCITKFHIMELCQSTKSKCKCNCICTIRKIMTHTKCFQRNKSLN